MKKNFILSVFALLITLPAMAADLNDAQLKNIADVQRNCVQRDWSQVQCKNIPSNDSRYQQTGFSPVSNVAEHALGWIPVLTDHLNAAKQSQAEAIYAELIAMLRETKTRNNLSDCQTACLATCASSSYAEYDDNAISDVNNSTTKILADGKGVCDNFATLANRFSLDLGLQSRKEFGDDHTFLGVRIGNQWQFLEPEVADCTIVGSSDR